ncbi:transposase [Marinisporobacter balticus]|nr:transposase [Marinisporobacter balticus]
MPRQAREKSSTGIYHIMLRGINRQNIFEEDKERQKFMETILQYKTISNYKLYGYCLMDNHVHLLIRETNEAISKVIKRISSSYVYWYNQKYDRCGHLFQERYKSEVVETKAYFLTALRYIHQNPVKARMIKDIETYFWSSYNDYIDHPVITDIDFALEIFSIDRQIAIELFKKHSKENNRDQCLDYKESINTSDDEIMKCLNQLGIRTVSELQRLEKEHRNNIIRKIKNVKGCTIRQLARITGISKSVIDRI